MTILRDSTIIIQFAPNIPGDAQAKAMMALEKSMRQSTGLEIEIFKEVMGDDSRLRAKMTTEQREKL